MAEADPYNLQRFVEAQGPVYQTALSELRAGRKRSHWMWYIFPQIASLGHSAMSQRYAISSLEEAKAYLAHGILGPRLRECTRIITGIEGRSALEIMGQPDDMKLHSCLTLFASASPEEALFRDALDRFFEGVEDDKTLARL